MICPQMITYNRDGAAGLWLDPRATRTGTQGRGVGTAAQSGRCPQDVRHLPFSEWVSTMQATELQQFEQSRQCQCDKCAEQCVTHPGVLAPGDLERIAAELSLDPTSPAFLAMFSAREDGPPAQVDGQYRCTNVIRPRMRRGRCVFLRDDGTCHVNKVKPFGCRVTLPCNHNNSHLSINACHRLIEILVSSWQHAVQWAMVHNIGATRGDE